MNFYRRRYQWQNIKAPASGHVSLKELSKLWNVNLHRKSKHCIEIFNKRDNNYDRKIYEISQWIPETCQGDVYETYIHNPNHRVVYYFQNLSDAVLFKLRWVL